MISTNKERSTRKAFTHLALLLFAFAVVFTGCPQIDLCVCSLRDESAFHLIFEFYAKGNIILTDHEYTIITLLRTHRQVCARLRKKKGWNSQSRPILFFLFQ